MTIAITSIANPTWGNADKTLVLCDITTTQFGDRVLPFCASPDDPEPHGRFIFEQACAGEYGPIAAFTAPDPTVQ